MTLPVIEKKVFLHERFDSQRSYKCEHEGLHEAWYRLYLIFRLNDESRRDTRENERKAAPEAIVKALLVSVRMSQRATSEGEPSMGVLGSLPEVHVFREPKIK